MNGSIPPPPPRPDLPLGQALPPLTSNLSLADQLRNTPWGWPDMIAVVLLAWGVSGLISALLVDWGTLSRDFVRTNSADYSGLSILAALWLWMRFIRPAPFSIFGRPAHRVREVALGLLLGAGVVLLNGVASVISYAIGTQILGRHPVYQAPNSGIHTVAGIAAFTVAAVVITPVAEEMLFRGFVYGTLSKKGRIGSAVIISAAWFALWHLLPIRFLGVFAIGIVFAAVYQRRKNLVATIVAHAVNNAVVTFFWIQHLARTGAIR